MSASEGEGAAQAPDAGLDDVQPDDDGPAAADDNTRPEVLAHLAVLRPKAARIAVLIAVIAFGLGIPAGYMTTQVRRAPLPAERIDRVKLTPRAIDVPILLLTDGADSAGLDVDLAQRTFARLTADRDPFRVRVSTARFPATVATAVPIQGIQDPDDAACRALVDSIADAGVGAGPQAITLFLMKAPAASASSSASSSAADGGRELTVVARGSVGVVRHGLHAGRLSDPAARAILTMLFSDPVSEGEGGGGEGAEVVTAAYQPPKGHQASASQAEPRAQQQMTQQRRSYHVAISLVHSDPSRTTVSWNAATETLPLVAPLISSLAPLMDVTVSTETLFYAEIATPPRYDKVGGRYVVDEAQFSEFASIPSLQQKSPAGHAARLKLLVYVPSPRHTPLVLASRSGEVLRDNTFLIPQWGAVVVAQPPANETGTAGGARGGDDAGVSAATTHLRVDVATVLEVLLPSLRQLLGVPAIDRAPTSAANRLEDWELDRARRRFAAKAVDDAVDALSGLRNLVERIPNMIIDAQMQSLVESAVTKLELVLHTAAATPDEGSPGSPGGERPGMSARELYGLCHGACQMAEAAFYDPKMLALLYFPEDEKYAVYVPFLVPAVVSIANAVIKFGPWRKPDR